MSNDDSLVEETAREHGMTQEQYMQIQNDRDWDIHQRDMFVQGSGLLSGQARTRDEFTADKIKKAIEEKRAKKAEEEKTQGILQILHQDTGNKIFLKVMVDTGANINAITRGMIVDCQLGNRVTTLKEPLHIDLAVGSVECHEQISIPWMGKGNEKHDTSTFYIFPVEKCNITDRAILSKEWLTQRGLLYGEDECHDLKPLIGGRQSASEKAAMERARQQAKADQASSSKAKDAHQKREGQKEQQSLSTSSSRPDRDPGTLGMGPGQETG